MMTATAPGEVRAAYDDWSDGRPRQLICRRIVEHPGGVKSFVLAAPDGAALHWAPGQYVTVTAMVEGRRVSRCYTVASPPTRPHTVVLTVKRIAGGELSPWLHDHLGVGDSLEIAPPAGDFSPAFHPAERYLLLAGGIGVTPLLSALRSFHDLASEVDAVLLHHVRSPAHVLFAEELGALNVADPGLRAVVVCDEGDPTWTGPVGRLRGELLDRHVPDLLDRDVLVCGPAAYQTHALTLLAAAGVAPDRVHTESFTLPEPPPVTVTPDGLGSGAEPDESGSRTQFVVRFTRSDREVLVPAGTTVLEASRQAGLRLPSSCTAGLCGTCKSSLLSGTVDMDHAGGIRPKEIASGKFLPCCSTPTDDLEVDA